MVIVMVAAVIMVASVIRRARASSSWRSPTSLVQQLVQGPETKENIIVGAMV